MLLRNDRTTTCALRGARVLDQNPALTNIRLKMAGYYMDAFFMKRVKPDLSGIDDDSERGP